MQSKKISRLYLATNGNDIILLCKVSFGVIFGKKNQRTSERKWASRSINPLLKFPRVTFIFINTLST